MEERKIKKIFKGNSISLSRFIHKCLYDKKLGFYQNNKIGSHFTTSPEISQAFGECVAIFLFKISLDVGVNKFLELGPGNGTLMSDVIRTISKLSKKDFLFYLYEKSSFLKKIQLNTLAKYESEKIKILSIKKLKLEEQPYLFFCNEFFDALPINQIEKKNDFLFEKRVQYIDGKFKWKKKLIENKNFNFLSNGDVLEHSPLTNLYIRKILSHIQKFGGGFLVIDYGPYIKKRISTIQAIHNSKKCNIFDYPFFSDITYHFDFLNLEKYSKKFNLKFHGPINQRQFLYFNGINERINSLINQTQDNNIKLKLSEQFRRLTNPSSMGELFKFVFISKNDLNLPYFKRF
mgnify:CR=1 FL=1